jgi:CRISPR-associated protein Cas2
LNEAKFHPSPFGSIDVSHRTALFAYDIHNPRVRRVSLKTLREWRLDGQLSVHECVLSEKEAARVFVQLNRDLDPQTDRLLLAWVQLHRPILSRGIGGTAGRDGGLLRVA